VAARLIGAARRLDPERAAVWDRREALIRARPASSPDDAGGSPPAREPGLTAGPAGPAQLAGWRELIETALTRPGALPAGRARKVITAWLSDVR
jgi:hypothetical protein